MLSYSVDGFIVTVSVDGATSPEERAAVIRAMTEDPAILPGSVLLLDVPESQESFDEAGIRLRVAALIRTLGSRMAPVCALVSPASHALENHLFQRVSAESGLRVGVFRDRASARAWLLGYVSDSAQ